MHAYVHTHLKVGCHTKTSYHWHHLREVNIQYKLSTLQQQFTHTCLQVNTWNRQRTSQVKVTNSAGYFWTKIGEKGRDGISTYIQILCFINNYTIGQNHCLTTALTSWKLTTLPRGNALKKEQCSVLTHIPVVLVSSEGTLYWGERALTETRDAPTASIQHMALPPWERRELADSC